MDITIIKSEGVSTLPHPVIASYSQGKVFLVLNIAVKTYQSVADQPSFDGKISLYRCTTVSLRNDGRITPEDLMKLLWQKELYSLLDDVFLCGIARFYGYTSYEDFSALLISGRYSYAEELACHRKALNGNTEELMTLNLFVEECKTLAKAAFLKMKE